jgi:hypothetical protein
VSSDLIDRRAACHEIGHHLPGDIRGPGRDALGHNAVIAREQNDRRGGARRPVGVLSRCYARRYLLEAPEAS